MVIIGIGANLPGRYGSPEEEVFAAIGVIEREVGDIISSSRIWLTSPVPVSDQPWYRNAVISVETQISPVELLRTLQKIEHDFGRVREVRNEPRVLDLDIVAYDDYTCDNRELTLPHPRMHERAFVLLPLQEIAPEWKHPVLKTGLPELIAMIPEGQKARPASEEVK